MGFFSVKFTPANWDLPLLKRELENEKLIAAYFARAILEGEVFPEMKELKPYLLQRPTQLTSVNQLGQHQRLALVLHEAKCCSRSGLLTKW